MRVVEIDLGAEGRADGGGARPVRGRGRRAGALPARGDLPVRASRPWPGARAAQAELLWRRLRESGAAEAPSWRMRGMLGGADPVPAILVLVRRGLLRPNASTGWYDVTPPRGGGWPGGDG